MDMDTHQLYGGSVTLAFDPVKHLYTANGVPADGVTTALRAIAKPALVDWAANMAAEHVVKALRPGQTMNEMSIKALANECRLAHRKKKEAAGDVGTFIHEWVEHFVKTGEEKDVEHHEIKAGVSAFKKWIASTPGMRFLASEGKVYSKTHNFAGTFDFILEADGRQYIGDLKTGKAIYPEHFLQTSAYQLALQEEFPGREFAGHIVVNCRKDGGLDIATSDADDFPENRDVFLAALKIHRWQKPADK